MDKKNTKKHFTRQQKDDKETCEKMFNTTRATRENANKYRDEIFHTNRKSKIKIK